MSRGLLSVLRDRSGASAAEFALILAPLIMLTLGSINAAAMVYTSSALHFAVENTARWTAIQATAGTLPGSTAVQAHGAGVYRGATTTVTFTSAMAACGVKITGVAHYNFTTGLTSNDVPISAIACYPMGTF
jgi:Flp pilus assembly protein TadG